MPVTFQFDPSIVRCHACSGPIDTEQPFSVYFDPPEGGTEYLCSACTYLLNRAALLVMQSVASTRRYGWVTETLLQLLDARRIIVGVQGELPQ